MRLRYHLPALAVGVATVLFVVAAMRYPGGTAESPSSVGYSWTHNFVSALFQPRALNGAPNEARLMAVIGATVLCVALAVVFVVLSRRIGSRPHRKAIEIGGIGASVYSLLIVTPMHDLMVSIGLLFSMATMFALVHVLYLDRRRFLLGWGLAAVALTVSSAVMYYGHLLYGYLPVVQKLGMATSLGWILSVYYVALAQRSMVTSAAAAPTIEAAAVTSPPEP